MEVLCFTRERNIHAKESKFCDSHIVKFPQNKKPDSVLIRLYECRFLPSSQIILCFPMLRGSFMINGDNERESVSLLYG
jgi:hypothetical protein